MTSAQLSSRSWFCLGRNQQAPLAVWDGRTSRVPKARWIGDASGMIDFLLLALRTLRAACRERGDLVIENLLLRHQAVDLFVVQTLTFKMRNAPRRPQWFCRPTAHHGGLR